MSQLERIFFIDRMIRDHGGISTSQIAHKFEVSGRQAKRDIEYMRDRLYAPIVWSRKHGRYEYSESWEGLRFADETTLLAFAFLKAILGHYAYVPVVSEETIGMLKAKLSGRYAAISDKVRYELPDMEHIDGETALALCQALLDTSASTSPIPTRKANLANAASCRCVLSTTRASGTASPTIPRPASFGPLPYRALR